MHTELLWNSQFYKFIADIEQYPSTSYNHAVGEREPERAGEATEAVRDTQRRPTTTYRRAEQ